MAKPSDPKPAETKLAEPESSDPKPPDPTPRNPPALSEEATKQVGEVLGLVKELKEARSLQTQQTTDIARCKPWSSF